jgi:hypothetical protein
LDYEFSTSPGYGLDSAYHEWDDEYGPNTEYYKEFYSWMKYTFNLGTAVLLALPWVPIKSVPDVSQVIDMIPVNTRVKYNIGDLPQ